MILPTNQTNRSNESRSQETLAGPASPGLSASPHFFKVNFGEFLTCLNIYIYTIYIFSTRNTRRNSDYYVYSCNSVEKIHICIIEYVCWDLKLKTVPWAEMKCTYMITFFCGGMEDDIQTWWFDVYIYRYLIFAICSYTYIYIYTYIYVYIYIYVRTYFCLIWTERPFSHGYSAT